MHFSCSHRSLIACVLLLPLGLVSAADAQRFVLVELFSSEGCSDCPKAEAVHNRLVAESQARTLPAIVLCWHVDYWDRLGWKDRFADKEYTKRQTAFAKMFKLKGPFTPQSVIGGSSSLNGQDDVRIRAAIAKQSAEQAAMTFSATAAWNAGGCAVSATVATAPEKTLFAAVIVENGLHTQVQAGENKGKSLDHSGVVRGYAKALLTPKGHNLSITAPSDVDISKASVVVFMQDTTTGNILACQRLMPNGHR